MENSEKLAGGITQEELSGWKLKYGNDRVKAVVVPIDDDGNTVTGYVRKPDLKTIRAAGKFAETDPVRSGMILFDNCFLGGDDSISADDELRMSVISALNTLFKVRVATIKNV